MQISFYVLSDQYLTNRPVVINGPSVDADRNNPDVSYSEAFLPFVCKLTQTVLRKSEHSLLIVDDNHERLAILDTQLWAFDAVSFVPHNLLTTSQPVVAQLVAPVTLVTSLPDGFDGVVLNLAAKALPISPTATLTLPERVLEIISPDPTSKQQGRDKYTQYRSQGFELIYLPIN